MEVTNSPKAIGLDILIAVLCLLLALLTTFDATLWLIVLTVAGGRVAMRAFDVRPQWAVDAVLLAVVVYLIQANIPFVTILVVGSIGVWRVLAFFGPKTQPAKHRTVSGSAKVQRGAKKAFRERPEQQGSYSARWADQADLAERDMYIETDEQFGRNLALGVRDGEMFGVKEGHANRRELGHFIASGATRAGKGRMLTANALIWPESLIVLDIKGENYATTAGQRAEYSRVVALHPNGKGNRYDPFAEMRGSNEGMRAAANIIIDAGQDKQPIFGQTAENALYAAFLGARLEDAPTLPYVQALLDEGVLGFVKHLASLDDKVINRALTQFLTVKPGEFTQDFFENSGLIRGAWGVINTRCSAFMTDGVMAMMSGSDFRAADLYDENLSLYLIFPESDMAATSKAFQIIMTSLINSLNRDYDDRAAEGNAPSRQLLWLLDEAGRTPIVHLDTYISTVAGRGMIFGLFIQDLPQLEQCYGIAGETVRANIRTQVYYQPTEDATAQYLEKRLGLYSIVREREVEGDGIDAIFNVFDPSYGREFHSEANRPLMTVSELYQMPMDDVIVFAASTPPTYARRLEPNEVFDDLDQLPKAPPLALLEPVDYVLQPRAFESQNPIKATPVTIPTPKQDAPVYRSPPAQEKPSNPGDPEF